MLYIYSLLSDNTTKPLRYKPQYNKDLSNLFGGKIEGGELVIEESGGARLLPCGIFARWSKKYCDEIEIGYAPKDGKALAVLPNQKDLMMKSKISYPVIKITKT